MQRHCSYGVQGLGRHFVRNSVLQSHDLAVHVPEDVLDMGPHPELVVLRLRPVFIAPTQPRQSVKAVTAPCNGAVTDGR